VELNNQDLFKMILEADDEGFAGGETPKQRQFTTVQRVMAKLGRSKYALNDPLAVRLMRFSESFTGYRIWRLVASISGCLCFATYLQM
jgi:hypothetical protein